MGEIELEASNLLADFRRQSPIRICMLGASGVGKSLLISRMLQYSQSESEKKQNCEAILHSNSSSSTSSVTSLENCHYYFSLGEPPCRIELIENASFQDRGQIRNILLMQQQLREDSESSINEKIEDFDKKKMMMRKKKKMMISNEKKQNQLELQVDVFWIVFDLSNSSSFSVAKEFIAEVFEFCHFDPQLSLNPSPIEIFLIGNKKDIMKSFDPNNGIPVSEKEITNFMNSQLGHVAYFETSASEFVGLQSVLSESVQRTFKKRTFSKGENSKRNFFGFLRRNP